MQRIKISGPGGPEKLFLEQAPDPTPRAGEVRIRVKATGINFADILARQGLYPDAPPMPCVVGYEVSGVIDVIGEGVDSLREGDAVLALTRFNGYADVLCVPQTQVFAKPESLSFEQAAGLPVTYLTAWQLLVVMGSLRADEAVLIHNAGGGVGLAAIDIARHIGATIYGTASVTKHDFLRERGLHHAIDYRSGDWAEALSELTEGKGVELITDPLGGSNWKKSYKALRHTGRLGMFGISSATESRLFGPLRLAGVAVSMPLFLPISLMNQNRSVFGVNLGHLWHETDKIRVWMQQLLDGVAEGWVRPHVDASFPLADAGRAHSYIEERRNTGKVVMIP